LANDSRHQGVVAFVEDIARAGSFDEVLEHVKEPAFLLVLDGVQDPHNLGACLRVADAMGVHALVVPKDRAVGLSPVVHKVASGAAETVPLVTVTNLARALRDLKDKGIWVVGAAEGAAQLLFDASLSYPGNLRRTHRRPDAGSGGKPECIGGGRHLPIRSQAPASCPGGTVSL
jgi:23S rRNA (guanosine2251-2'-O)-methyltransferase